MEDPIQVALAAPVAVLPLGPYFYEPKYDGHRMILRRDAGGVRCQARSGGRSSTSAWPDLAEAAMDLEPGTILDGEAVVFTGGKVDFGAAQSRMASALSRVAVLAREHPGSFAAFDVLATARHGDVRARPWSSR